MILALACIIPVVFIFMISISSEHSIKMNGYQFIPSAYSLDSYKFLLREGQMIVTALGVSVVVTVIGTVIGVALTMLMGYVCLLYTSQRCSFRFFLQNKLSRRNSHVGLK